MPAPTSKDAKTKREKLVESTAPPSKSDQRRAEAKDRQVARRQAYDRNRRQWMITKIVAIALVVGIVGALIGVAINYSRNKASNAIPDGVKNATFAGGQHDDLYTSWPDNPPFGGVHNNVWQNCGYYSEPIGTGHGVHSLEHGAVWITYQPNLPQDQVDKLKSLAESQNYLLVSPYPGLPAPIVLSAWGHQLQIQSASDSRINQFIKAFKNNSVNPPPEPGALCSNGTSINGVQSTQTAEAYYTATAVAAAKVTPTTKP